jgi:phosphopantothenoylcysteine decarboxylase/phosphopantothenate--cysteine ligase
MAAAVMTSAAEVADEAVKVSDPDAAAPSSNYTDDVLAGAVRARADGQSHNLQAIVGSLRASDANGDVLSRPCEVAAAFARRQCRR